MANIKSFPNNQNEFAGAEDVMRWFHGRTSGVFGAEGNAAVAPVLDAMAVTVSDGNGWISNDNSDGVVWWIDNEAETGEKLQLRFEMADAVLPRIDRVVVSWPTTDYVALPEVSVLKGVPASAPAAPNLTNNTLLRQISLAAIRIPAGATAISADMITDERLDPAVCGIVTDSVSVDTSVANAQFTALLQKIRDSLEDVLGGQLADGSVTMEKLSPDVATLISGAQPKHITTICNLIVSGWSNLTQTVSVDGVTANNTVIAVPAPETFTAYGQAGVYCSAQANGSLTFKCKTVPAESVSANILILN